MMSYNILDGGIGRADPIGEILEAAKCDVVTLLEADDEAVVERLARRLKFDYVMAAGKRHKAAILSRYAIAESTNYAALLPEMTDCFVTAELVLPGAKRLGLAAVHLHPHSTIAEEQIRLQELKTILQTLEPWRRGGKAHLLAGDFNADSPIQKIDVDRVKPRTRQAMQQAGGTVPREAIAEVLAAGYFDTLHARHQKRAGEMYSFTTQFPGQRVDFIFSSGIDISAIKGAWIETDRLAQFASDHYPIGVEIA